MNRSWTDEELKEARAEMDRRAREAEESHEARLRRINQTVVDHVDVFLALCEKHDRTSCSDEDPCNARRARCCRCVLLEAKRTGYLPSDEYLVCFHFESLNAY